MNFKVGDYCFFNYVPNDHSGNKDREPISVVRIDEILTRYKYESGQDVLKDSSKTSVLFYKITYMTTPKFDIDRLFHQIFREEYFDKYASKIYNKQLVKVLYE